MSSRAGATAAVASSVWGAALALAAVPIYISRLGIEAYGLVGFFITSQAVVQVLDLGLAPVVNREMARSAALGDMVSARTLLRTLQRLYWLTGAAVAILIAVSASMIATSWLKVAKLPSGDVAQSILLMGMLIGVRWPIALYQNTMIGMERLVTSSALNAAASTTSIGLSIAAVYVWPQPQALFAVQATVSLIHALVARDLAWRALGGHQGATVRLAALNKIWRFSGMMGIVVLTSVALTQLDKIILSKMLPLAAFGEYMLAATVIGGLAVLVGPLFNTIYPRFSALVALGQSEALVAAYHKYTRCFAIAYLPVVTALGAYAYDIVALWTGKPDTAAAVAPIISILCIGSAINGLMYFPYSLQLATGKVSLPLSINVVLLVVAGPLIIVLTITHAGLGGAIAWAVLEIMYLLLGTYLTHRRIAIGSGVAWLSKSVAAPAAATLAMAALLHPLVLLATAATPARVAAVAASVLISIGLCVLVFPDTRASLLATMRSSKVAANEPV
jgi:O-antigen/teichoic acid export membrane protein